MSYKLRVSEKGVLRSIADQFTSKTTFISEAIQNCRRAGADTINIVWEPDQGVLTIRDNGSGISSFADLLNIGESNWDDLSVVDIENPFGIGFASCITATEAVEIRSRNECVNFISKELLAAKPATSTAVDFPLGTELKLWLRPCHIPGSMEVTVKNIARGFPIPVFFNGVNIERGDALDVHGGFFVTPIGVLSLPDLAKNTFSHWDVLPRLYFQGLRVIDNRLRNNGVLHLNPSEFRVRVPDRDVLIDSDEQKDRIRGVVKSLYQERLIALKSELSPDAFVKTHWRDCVNLGLSELLNDLPITHSMLDLFIEPARAVEGECIEEYTGSLDDLGVVVTASTHAYQGDDEQTVLRSVYALKRNLPRLTDGFPASHRLYEQAIKLDDESINIRYTLNGESRVGTIEGRWAWFRIVTCDSYTIECAINPESACIIDIALLPPITVSDTAFFDHQTSTLIVPSSDTCPADALVQTAVYEDEGFYLKDAYDADYDDLVMLIDELRTDSPQAYLNTLLQRLSPNQALLPKDMVFSVSFDDEKNRLLTEVA